MPTVVAAEKSYSPTTVSLQRFLFIAPSTFPRLPINARETRPEDLASGPEIVIQRTQAVSMHQSSYPKSRAGHNRAKNLKATMIPASPAVTTEQAMTACPWGASPGGPPSSTVDISRGDRAVAAAGRSRNHWYCQPVAPFASRSFGGSRFEFRSRGDWFFGTFSDDACRLSASWYFLPFPPLLLVCGVSSSKNVGYLSLRC